MMRRKLVKTLPLVAVVGLIAAIPASTANLDGEESEGRVHLPLVIFVNRMELSRDQMERIHEVLVGVLEQKEALEEHVLVEQLVA